MTKTSSPQEMVFSSGINALVPMVFLLHCCLDPGNVRAHTMWVTAVEAEYRYVMGWLAARERSREDEDSSLYKVLAPILCAGEATALTDSAMRMALTEDAQRTLIRERGYLSWYSELRPERKYMQRELLKRIRMGGKGSRRALPAPARELLLEMLD